MRILGIVLAVFALATPVCAEEIRQRDTTAPIMVETEAQEQQAIPYQLKWQRRLLEIQTAFATTLATPIDRVETGSITRPNQ